MSKVLIDRGLLERAVSIPTKESLEANQAAIVDRGRAQSDIRELLAQPAEAEGVEVVGFLYKNNGGALTAADMDSDTFVLMARADFDGEIEKLVRQVDHLAALAAVTAERDRLLAELERAYANYNQVSYASTKRGKQIDQLRAEVEDLLAHGDRVQVEIASNHKRATPHHETPCDHEWTDDGLHLLVCTSCGAKEDHDPGWRDMTTAPRDGTLVRLLVEFDENSTEDTDQPAPTIGANNHDNDGEDRWQFAGWCWSHDCFTEGQGEPVGWLPIIDPIPQTPRLEQLDPLHGLREAWAFWRACKADLTSRDTGAWGDAQSWLTDELHQLFETGPYEKSPQ